MAENYVVKKQNNDSIKNIFWESFRTHFHERKVGLHKITREPFYHQVSFLGCSFLRKEVWGFAFLNKCV